ncbi:MAG TPA: hypothetical protein VFA12_14555 [Stellaceae bacterium]|nr:hypothetical protein [Stellaceae bacterium]
MSSFAAVPVAASDPPAAVQFLVQAAAEPGVMPRLFELFAKRGLVPQMWHSTVCGAEHTDLTIEIRVSGLPQETVSYIGACMRQIASVRAVLTAETAGAAFG